jgi:hypothetical protein
MENCVFTNSRPSYRNGIIWRALQDALRMNIGGPDKESGSSAKPVAQLPAFGLIG